MKKLKAFPNKSHVFKKPKGDALKQLVGRARDIRQHLDEVKPLYKELEAITLALIPVQHKLGSHGCTMVDNFATKNVAFKNAAVNRFVLEWVKR